MKFTTSKRVTPCSPSMVTAGQSRSAKRATRTLAPLSSFFPELCTCMAARCTARLKPSESEGNWASASSGMGSTSSSRNFSSRFFRLAGSPPA